MRKRAILIIFTGFILLLVIGLTDRVLMVKTRDGASSLLSYYEQDENTIDVLLMGSSNTGLNLDAEVLWTEYGIPGFALWGSSQPFWNTYFYLKEALKTQSPRVIVLDVYAARLKGDYLDTLYRYNNIIGMKRNLNRILAIRETAQMDEWALLFFGLPIYHSRFSELTKDDFSFFSWSSERKADKGTDVRYGHLGNIDLTIDKDLQKAEINEKEVVWLQKIIDLTEEKNIQLILIKTPVNDRALSEPYYQAVTTIAEQRNIPYYDFNMMDDITGIVWSDFWIDGNHLNTNGSRKATRCLVEYLLKHVQLQDKRGDEKYRSWDAFSRMMQNEYLGMITDWNDYLKELERAHRTIILVCNSEDDKAQGIYRDICQSVGGTQKEMTNGTVVVVSEEGNTLATEELSNGYYEGWIKGMFLVTDFSGGNGVTINDVPVYQYKLMDPSVICISYDQENNKVVDVVSFRRETEYQMERISQ